MSEYDLNPDFRDQQMSDTPQQFEGEFFDESPGWLYTGNLNWALRGKAIQALAEKDALGFLLCGANDYGLDTTWRSRGILQSLGIFEEALLHAITACRVNNHHAYSLIARCLTRADKAKLRAAGDPLPTPGPFRLFRGIAGRGRARRPRGYSWTDDRERAEWFAKRAGLFGLHAPAVVEASVPTRNVVFCSFDRDEREFFCDLPKDFPVFTTPVVDAVG